MGNHKKLLQFLRPDPAVAAAPARSSTTSDDEDDGTSCSTPATPTTSASAAASPYASSPWTHLPGLGPDDPGGPAAEATGLLGSLVKEDGGHVYSLAAAGDLLYTGTDSRTVRVWRERDRRELGGFRSGSGLVKAIVVGGDGRVYTGHQDGKVRVWRAPHSADEVVEDPSALRRVGTLPRLRDVLRSSLLRPSQPMLRHSDAVSALSLDAEAGLIYSASWDRTFKVWRVSDSRCLESVVRAHGDAVNAVAAAGFDALVLTGSADGTVKAWRRRAAEGKGRATRHAMERVLREGDGAVTAIAVCAQARVAYAGSSDGAVAHWHWPRGAAPRSGAALRGHKMAVLCLAVAGRVVVSGSADRTISVWRRGEGASHALLAVLAGHTGPVKCIAMDQKEEEDNEGAAPRRWVVYSGSLDGSVKVWRVSESDGGGSFAPDLAMSTPARHWKGFSPSPPPRAHRVQPRIEE
ncbi:Protein JINGUBANG [Zea mays]|uniref:Protein JINGUBANG n=1 Tax=Zea mays TaxID=4577 RepID=A0A3L6FLZ6_MAIZE|nr:Protein JINGUBANG [Zea mays]